MQTMHGRWSQCETRLRLFVLHSQQAEQRPVNAHWIFKTPDIPRRIREIRLDGYLNVWELSRRQPSVFPEGQARCAVSNVGWRLSARGIRGLADVALRHQ